MADAVQSGTAERRSFAESLAVYLRPRVIIVLLLGFSSGLPLALSGATLAIWMTERGVNLGTIGLFSLVGLPYTFKFIWAPVVDALNVPFFSRALGRRRGWLVFSQLILAAAIVFLGSLDPVAAPFWVAFGAVMVAAASATQDIVIDAYRIEILSDAELPHGTAMNQFGYRTGNLIAGAGTIYLASAEGAGLGWAAAYGLTAFCVIPAIIGALIAGPGIYIERHVRAAGQTVGGWLMETVVNPFREFLGRRGAVLILLFVLIYKIGDAMGQIMLAPMIVELGFSDTEYVAVNKFVGFGALIFGSALGAPFIAWLGMGRALLFSGLLMMVSNFLFAVLAMAGDSNVMLGLAVGFENMTSGIGLTVFVTYLSGLSSLAYTATQFALLSSFAAVGRTWLSTPSGILAEELGWVGFWLMTVAVAVPGMLLLWMLWRKGFVVQSVRQPSTEDDGHEVPDSKPAPATG